jgi:hypothetical protein
MEKRNSNTDTSEKTVIMDLHGPDPKCKDCYGSGRLAMTIRNGFYADTSEHQTTRCHCVRMRPVPVPMPDDCRECNNTGRIRQENDGFAVSFPCFCNHAKNNKSTLKK